MAQAAVTVALTLMEAVVVAAVAALPHAPADMVAERKSTRMIDKARYRSRSRLGCAADSAIGGATLILPVNVCEAGRQGSRHRLWRNMAQEAVAAECNSWLVHTACDFTNNKDFVRLKAGG
jgi:hypothetical protein